ncbi:MAG: arsenical pump-driving ATPase [Campylobacteraceae bacterium]|nr:arsenical pump-driving ATPase [Campylobacteraceae bacterium]
MKELLKNIPKFVFFTGKGGVGKTSMSCAISLALSKMNKKVLLISTDPASNLDEVLDTKLGSTPSLINNTKNLFAMNINPVIAANEYKEKVVGPYRDLLPKEAINQMEEQLSGACSVEIAGFNEFSKYVGDNDIIKQYDHIILDTAPTGHTLRLLNLPSAWKDFIANNQTGSSCLGPVSGLVEQKILYEQVVDNLKDSSKTLLILVSRAEKLSLLEVSKASKELNEQGMKKQHLLINGVFKEDSSDEIAQAFYQKSKEALAVMPENLKNISSNEIGFYPQGVLGLESLEAVINNEAMKEDMAELISFEEKINEALEDTISWKDLLNDIQKDKSGLIMTMGKGGVGKTSIASLIAYELSSLGHKVTLSTTDPAAHLDYIKNNNTKDLIIEKIDPKYETQKHISRVIKQNENKLSSDDMALLKEELNSPCIEEIAIFEAFASTVNKAKERFVVLDTAPTGHTLMLLDASNAYHKELSKNVKNENSDDLIQLIPLLKDKKFTKILLLALAEATPTHEAKALQEDLQRAGITPYAWVINRSFVLCKTSNRVLQHKALNEVKYINEIKNTLSKKVVISPWIKDEINNSTTLKKLLH